MVQPAPASATSQAGRLRLANFTLHALRASQRIQALLRYWLKNERGASPSKASVEAAYQKASRLRNLGERRARPSGAPKVSYADASLACPCCAIVTYGRYRASGQRALGSEGQRAKRALREPSSTS